MRVEMKRIAFVVAPVLSVFLLPFACSSDPDPVTTVGGTGGGTGGTVSNGGNGGDGGDNGACGADCSAQCDASLVTPSDGSCVLVGGPIQCNPVSNAGCNTPAGEACDYGPGGFSCYPGPNEAELCWACSASGPHCGPGFTCTEDGVCAKFCCNDGDCGSGGICAISGQLNVGHCVKGSGGPGVGGSGPGVGGSGPGVGGSGPGVGGSGGSPVGPGGGGGVGGAGVGGN